MATKTQTAVKCKWRSEFWQPEHSKFCSRRRRRSQWRMTSPLRVIALHSISARQTVRGYAVVGRLSATEFIKCRCAADSCSAWRGRGRALMENISSERINRSRLSRRTASLSFFHLRRDINILSLVGDDDRHLALTVHTASAIVSSVKRRRIFILPISRQCQPKHNSDGT